MDEKNQPPKINSAVCTNCKSAPPMGGLAGEICRECYLKWSPTETERPKLNIPARIQALSDELGKSTGEIDTGPPPRKWKPYWSELELSLGDRVSWEDHFLEALQPNTLSPTRRTLSGELIHAYCGRWGWGVRFRLLSAPDGDSLKAGDIVHRMDGQMHDIKRVLDA